MHVIHRLNNGFLLSFIMHLAKTFATQNHKWRTGFCARPDRATRIIVASLEYWILATYIDGRLRRLSTDREQLCSRFLCHFGVCIMKFSFYFSYDNSVYI